jgi:hypothetical protein
MSKPATFSSRLLQLVKEVMSPVSQLVAVIVRTASDKDEIKTLLGNIDGGA